MTLALILVVLTLPGILPARLIAGSWPLALTVAPLVTATACGYGAMAAVVTGTPLLPWAVGLLIAAHAITVRKWSARRTDDSDVLSWFALAVIVGAVVVMLTPLTHGNVEWDARATWFRLARWLWDGGAFTQQEIGNQAHRFNRDYPPFGAATIAMFWRVGPGISDRSAQLLIGVLNGAAVATAALAFGRLFRAVQVRVFAILVGVAFVVTCFSVTGRYGFAGYQDLLWAASITGAVLYLLIAPKDSGATWVGVLLAAGAAITKNEAMLPALLVAVLGAWRFRTWVRRRPAILVGLPFLAVWPSIARHFGSGSEYEASVFFKLLTGDHELWRRLDPTWGAMQPYLRLPTLLALLLAVIGAFTISAVRRRAGLGSSWQLWIVWAGIVGSLTVAYLIANSTIEVHLDSSIDRTTVAAHVLVVAELAVWTLTAFAFLTGPAIDVGDSDQDEEPAPAEIIILTGEERTAVCAPT